MHRQTECTVELIKPTLRKYYVSVLLIQPLFSVQPTVQLVYFLPLKPPMFFKK